jgi:site-specific DNA recombinase
VADTQRTTGRVCQVLPAKAGKATPKEKIHQEESPMVKRAIVYSRVSTDAQERDGTSLETQERACLEYASSYQVVQTIRDTASGFTLDRPGIDHLRQLLRQGAADVVVAYAVDRLSRNQNHIGVLFDEVEQAGAKLEFVTENFEDTAIGRFILAARAFIAEVEREKIAERTMRGKEERARSGKLPQGTGKGCYGYTYNQMTGQRMLNDYQAAVVARIFEEFLSRKSIVSIANLLNDEGIPTFNAGKWHAPTVYHVLRNETYTGRTLYRRTTVQQVREPATGKKRRKVALRDSNEWIEIPDVTPAIVGADIFAAAQQILDDPERRRRGKRKREYGLSGRLRCLRCGRAMVGQTLQDRYKYYKCRRSYAGPHHDRCDAVYVRAGDLEAAVKQEISQVLANPERILEEHMRLITAAGSVQCSTDLIRQMEHIDKKRRRLVKLYEMGEIEEEYFEAELAVLKNQRDEIDERLSQSCTPTSLPALIDLESACKGVRGWIERAEGENISLLLDALQIGIRAEKGRGELSGVIPDYASTCDNAHVCSVVKYFTI